MSSASAQLTTDTMPPKATTQPAKLSPQEVPAVFQRYRTELQNLAQKIGELESELEEHSCVDQDLSASPASLKTYRRADRVFRLVLSTLQPLTKSDPERICYRLIGGVLVERSVVDVVPALETNHSGIQEVLQSLVKSYKAKEEDFSKFQKDHGIQVSFHDLLLLLWPLTWLSDRSRASSMNHHCSTLDSSIYSIPTSLIVHPCMRYPPELMLLWYCATMLLC